MTFNPVTASREIFERYCNYITTTFRLNDERLNVQIKNALREPGRFARGPILEVTPPFVHGRTIEELINENVLSSHLARLQTDRLPLDRPLYLHQEEAVRRICKDERNVVVATGTGSGKTECFMIPILNHLFEEIKNGTLNPGVRALLLYPMNALANDQIKRLRGLLADEPNITFGIYTGETEEYYADAHAKYVRMYQNEPLPNELISREQMKASPPHIMLTNYAMLEYLMLRPADNVFFHGPYARNWKFVVIDEAHTYTGAKGIEMAMLLARLKDAIGVREGQLRCILTSASLGEGSKDATAVAKFASSLFQEEFTESDIITATRLDYAADADVFWGTPVPSMYKALLTWLDSSNRNPDEVHEILKCSNVPHDIIAKVMAVIDNDPAQALYHLLRGDSGVGQMITVMQEGPVEVTHLATEVFGDTETAVEDTTALVDLCNRARSRSADNPLLPARFHFLVKALEGAFIVLTDNPRIYLERINRIRYAEHDYRAFEIGACTRCNGLYLIGELARDSTGYEYLEPIKNQYQAAANSSVEYFALATSDIVETENEDEFLEGLGIDLPKYQWYRLCVHCGGIGSEHQDKICGCSESRTVRVLKANTRGRSIHKCGLCGAVNSRTSVVRRFYLSEDAVSSVLATSLYQQIPGRIMEVRQEDMEDDEFALWFREAAPSKEAKRTKQLLVFSDSRQNAAYFAPYLGSTYRDLAARSLLVKTLEKYRTDCLTNRWSLADLNRRVTTEVKAMGFTKESHETLSHEVWKWIMREFSVDTGLWSLENMGLLVFEPDYDRIEHSEHLFTMPFLQQAGFTKEEAKDLYSFFLDQFRYNLAVEYPESVSPQDESFAPKNQQGGFWLRRPPAVKRHPAGYSLKGWLPAEGAFSNTRLDYLVRLLEADHTGTRIPDTVTLLGQMFEAITHYMSPLHKYIKTEHTNGAGKIYKLDPAVYKVMPGRENPAVAYFRCDTCFKVTRFNIRGVCPGFRCSGKLHRVDLDSELQDNHYRYLYLNLNPEPMEVHEHTAQLATEYAAEVQTRFIKGDINVLSCSTTFELGVDVGELETVFMKNVPPTPANYAQRAGRAGRRTDSTAYALTFARLSSHDFSQFRQPEKMISGVVRPPHFELTNTKIARRHMYACAFAHFWRQHPEFFGTVGDFFGNDGPSRLKTFLDNRPKALQLALQNVIPQSIQEELGLTDWSWVEEMYNAEGVMNKVVSEYNADVQALNDALEEALSAEQYRQADRLQKIRNTIVQRPLIGYLSQKNILPKYGFPVDVVNLDVNFHTSDARNIDLSRDMQIAISEYAPGSQVVANGKVWTSRYLKKVPSKEFVRYSYLQCRCGYFEKAFLDVDIAKECPVCGTSQTSNHTFIVPEFGFIAEGKPKVPGSQRPERTYSSRKFFSGISDVVDQDKNLAREVVIGGNVIKLRTHAHGVLTVINNGRGYGFYICRSCGFGALDNVPDKHSNSFGRDCKGSFERVSLGYDFETDIVEIDFSQVLAGLVPEEGYWESFMYSVVEGLSAALEIDRQDIDATLYVNRMGRRSIILFDTVPGGAGHVKRILEDDNCVLVLKTALHIVENCHCGGTAQDTSCYGCLRNYQNQFIHYKLQRRYAIDALRRTLDLND